eukprot:gene41242-55773_t
MTKSATSRTTKASRKPVSGKAAAGKAAGKAASKPAKSKPAKLPEWNLADLYSSIDAPEVTRDLDRIDAECASFEADYKGKLATETAKPDGGAWLAGAVRRYEAIDDLAGRLGSYAGLIHAGDSVDPAISKFYGDVSERITAASVHLLFFGLELNRVDDAVIEKAMQTPELGHYRPWIEDSRKDKPYQLEDRVEQLFHEKSQTGYGAFNRLFDQTIAGLRFKVGGKEQAIEPTLTMLQDRAPAKRKAAGQALAVDLDPLRAQGLRRHGRGRCNQHVPVAEQGIDLVAGNAAKALCTHIPGGGLQGARDKSVHRQRFK